MHGIKRRTSLFNTDRIDHLYQDPHVTDRRFILHYGDMTDSSSLVRVVQLVQPDEIYNLAAQSHVAVSFEEPEYTANSDALGALRMLEAIRILGLEKKTRFYQASTSELYGKVQETPQKETTPFYPRSPYAVAKLYAYWITVNYREAYGMYACNGILFNHESPVARRNLRHPQDHARWRASSSGCRTASTSATSMPSATGATRATTSRCQWLMLQQDKPEDFVIATGEQHSVRAVRREPRVASSIFRFKGAGGGGEGNRPPLPPNAPLRPPPSPSPPCSAPPRSPPRRRLGSKGDVQRARGGNGPGRLSRGRTRCARQTPRPSPIRSP